MNFRFIDYGRVDNLLTINMWFGLVNKEIPVPIVITLNKKNSFYFLQLSINMNVVFQRINITSLSKEMSRRENV